ncbi:MAG TPA: PIG-L family deacetylase [Fimbriimonadaceae bacterium]|nr:PIG-L family deacetylase [Fimbriimonadaceae bacterium]
MSDNAPLLVFGAHPDDVEFGCGGVVAQEARAGRPVHMVVCSRGEAGTAGTPEIREAESRNAAAILGADLEFMELDGDARLRSRVSHAITLAGVIRRIRPGVVMAPSPSENQHPDHAQLGRLVRDAARLARFGGISELAALPPHSIASLFYYALSLEAEPPDVSPVLYDVSDSLDTWVAAMEAHASQVRARPYVEMQLTRARSRGLSAGTGHAIALFPADPIVVTRLEPIATGARSF